jgi:biotin carboxylase
VEFPISNIQSLLESHGSRDSLGNIFLPKKPWRVKLLFQLAGKAVNIISIIIESSSILNAIVISMECHWSITANESLNSSIECWQTVDILLRKNTEPVQLNYSNGTTIQPGFSVVLRSVSGDIKVSPDQFGSPDTFNFFLACLGASCSTPEDKWRGLKLIVPCISGYIVRSDIIPLRLVDCPLVESVVSFAQPQQKFAGDAIEMDSFEQITEAFAAAASGLLMHQSLPHHSSSSELQEIETELHNRLSFPWILDVQPRPLTLALFLGGKVPPERAGTSASIYPAAKALGIKIIVLDTPGHWIEDAKYENLREAFIPIDIEQDDGLPNRIIEAIRGRQVDGIATFFESWGPYIAKVAKELSLPTVEPDALEIAADKYKTSLAAGHKAYRAASLDQAKHIIQNEDIHYPLILKPCMGWLSEGVSRVQNDSELSLAIGKIDTDRHGVDFVIEEYCSGPEVDVNLVIDDGELLFFEVSDEFPKLGDGDSGSSKLGNFIELANVLPSALPTWELRLLRESLHQNLLQIGLHTGVYHLEARVKDSTMDYVSKNGLIELERRRDKRFAPNRSPTSWLIEINARSPGIQASNAIQSTYGIDYWALCLLFSLGDKERARALSHPFRDGPQYWCQIVFIPVENGGVFDSGDICEELMLRRPDLASYISNSFCFFKRGDIVPAPESGLTAWIAYFNIFSRTSRKHVLEIAERVRQEVYASIK